MASFLVWIATCVCLYFALSRHPVLLLTLPVAVRILIPSVANPILVGATHQFNSLHAATWMIFVFFLLTVVVHASRVQQAISRSGTVFLLLTLLIVEQFLSTLAQRPAHLLSVPANTFIGPFLFFLLFRVFAGRDEFVYRKFARNIVVLAVLECALGIAQWWSHSVLVLEHYQALHYWFNAATFSRAQGTLDSPLDFALLLVLAAALVGSVRPRAGRALAFFAIGIGALVASSRLGAVFVVVEILYGVGRSMSAATSRLITRVTFGLIATAALSTVLASDLIGRVANDAGSSDARSIAYDYFWSHILSFGVLGGGSGSATEVQTGGAIGSSLENGYAMYAVSFGAVAALVLIAVQLHIVFGRRGRTSDLAFRVGAVCVMLTTFFYSSFMTLGAASLLVWVSLALASGHDSEAPTTIDPRKQRQRVEFAIRPARRPRSTPPVRAHVGA